MVPTRTIRAKPPSKWRERYWAAAAISSSVSFSNLSRKLPNPSPTVIPSLKSRAVASIPPKDSGRTCAVPSEPASVETAAIFRALANASTPRAPASAGDATNKAAVAAATKNRPWKMDLTVTISIPHDLPIANDDQTQRVHHYRRGGNGALLMSVGDTK